MKNSLLNRVIAGVLIATSGCFTATYLMAAPTTAPATTAPSTAPAEILAQVNGQDIDEAKFQQLLMSIAGMRLLEQVIDLIVAEQACAQAGIDVNAPAFKTNIQAELDRALSDIGAQGVPEAQRPDALRQVLAKQGVTNQEFQMGLRRAACLRALAKDKVTITNKNLEDAFNAEYGEKAQGRLFIVHTMEEASDLRKAIDGGKEPSEAAASMGIQSQVVTLPKSAEGENIKLLKDTIFGLSGASGMKEKQLSAALPQPEGGSFILFYMDKKIPAQTATFESVKEKLRAQLTEQGERAWANNHLQNLRRMANIKINDPILSQQYGELIKRLNAAATQPATAPATAPAK